MSVVDISRLISPDDEPETAFELVTSGEPLLITDPTYIADYFATADPDSRYIRQNGVVLANFGGDLPCSVYWDAPFLVARFQEDGEEAGEGTLLESDVAIDSGHLLFLPLVPAIPASLSGAIDEALERFGAVSVTVPAGRWTFAYEHCDEANGGWKRNVVGRWTRV